MNELQAQSKIIEFTISDNTDNIVETLLLSKPKIIGFSLYIWNLNETLASIKLIKRIKPVVKIVIGGPEVASENEELFDVVDYIVHGDGEIAFYELCKNIISNKNSDKHISAGVNLANIKTAYNFYTDDDIKNRIIYVESARGCPYKCSFCTSSLETGIRFFPEDSFFEDMTLLLKRGVKTFKFLDRSFNADIKKAEKILAFFLPYFIENRRENLFLHFEMVAERFPDSLRNIIKKFPKDSMQFEIGIQSFTDSVNKSINKIYNKEKAIENIKWLSAIDAVTVHADLILGLPNETIDTIAESFNLLWNSNPNEIQIGILKYLGGTNLLNSQGIENSIFRDSPPYDILKSKEIPFEEMQNLKRFARYFELFANKHNFDDTIELFLKNKKDKFNKLYNFSKWLWKTAKRTHKISGNNQYELFMEYLINETEIDKETILKTLRKDFCKTRSERQLPKALRINAKDTIKTHLH